MTEHKINPTSEDKANAKPKSAPRKLIFLMGFADTGKDTTFELIKKTSMEPVIRVSFADALKTECYPKMKVDPKEYSVETDDRKWKDAHRDEIIRYGEGQKHIHGMYYWVQRALDPVLFRKDFSKIKASQIPHIVVTDCRRTEEVMWFKEFKMHGQPEYREIYDPIMFVIHREDAEKKDRDYLSHVALQYAAETRVFDKMIKNYDTVAKLEQQIKDIYAVKIR
jgi:hypothetical protein